MSQITVLFSLDPSIQEEAQWTGEWLIPVLHKAVSFIPQAPSTPMEVTIAVVTDEVMTECYKRFKGIEKTTNVLAFPTASEGESFYYDPHGTIILGDIVLSFSEVQRQADAMGISLKQHITHLVVHGFLHLFHYDHETDSEAQMMEHLESQVMQSAGWPDPYAGLTI